MPALGAPELIIILVIIVLIFGVGKLPEVGQALGKGIREFRSANDDDKEKKEEADVKPVASAETAPPAAIVDASPSPAAITAAPAQPVGATAPAQPVSATAPAQSASAASPAQPASAAPPAPAAYTVQTGDTLDSVAQRLGITVESLMQANGYSQRDRVLYAGDRLQIPRPTASTS